MDDLEARMVQEEKTDAARSAFYRRVRELGISEESDLFLDAWDNSFSAECRDEYRDDLARWEVALDTLNFLADERGIVAV
jgi:hypothetical protein